MKPMGIPAVDRQWARGASLSSEAHVALDLPGGTAANQVGHFTEEFRQIFRSNQKRLAIGAG